MLLALVLVEEEERRAEAAAGPLFDADESLLFLEGCLEAEDLELELVGARKKLGKPIA